MQGHRIAPATQLHQVRDQFGAHLLCLGRADKGIVEQDPRAKGAQITHDPPPDLRCTHHTDRRLKKRMAIGRGPGRTGAIIDSVLQRAPEPDDQLRQRNFGDALGDGRSTGRDNQVATF